MLSTFRGYKGYLYWSENGMRRVRFFKTELARDLQAAEVAHVPSMPELKRHDSLSTTGQKVQTGRLVTSWLELTT